MPKSHYPPKALKETLIIAKTIFDKNAGKPMYRVTLAEELKYKSESRIFRDLITASAGYGLTTGSYISEKISLEPNGSEIAQSKLEAVYIALFSIEIFGKFYENFSSGGSKGIPSEKIARDFLQKECGIPESQSKTVYENIIQDAKDFFLIQNIAGGDKFVPIELAKSKVKPEYSSSGIKKIEENNNPNHDLMTGDHESNKGEPSFDISPRLQLNIEIHIAADTSEDKIEAIFKNMRKYLLTDGKSS